MRLPHRERGSSDNSTCMVSLECHMTYINREGLYLCCLGHCFTEYFHLEVAMCCVELQRELGLADTIQVGPLVCSRYSEFNSL
jgi:hypothetical protein